MGSQQELPPLHHVLAHKTTLHHPSTTTPSTSLGADAAAQLEDVPFFVDFMRDASPDADGAADGDVRPSVYEAVTGGLAALRCALVSRLIGMQRVLSPSAPPLTRPFPPFFSLPSSRCEALQARAVAASRGAVTPLVLFADAVAHVGRLTRVLAMDRGSALLVGVGGSGKQSLARLAATIAGATPFQIAASRTYGPANFLDDLKGMYRVTGIKGQHIAFILRRGRGLSGRVGSAAGLELLYGPSFIHLTSSPSSPFHQ